MERGPQGAGGPGFSTWIPAPLTSADGPQQILAEVGSAPSRKLPSNLGNGQSFLCRHPPQVQRKCP